MASGNHPRDGGTEDRPPCCPACGRSLAGISPVMALAAVDCPACGADVTSVLRQRLFGLGASGPRERSAAPGRAPGRTSGLLAGGVLDFGLDDAVRFLPPEADADTKRFLVRLASHVFQLRGQKESVREFVDALFKVSVMRELALAASQLIRLTRADHEEHSHTIVRPPVSCVVCTVPTTLQQARNWFLRRHGGYSRLLESLWTTQVVPQNCSVLVHIPYGDLGEAGGDTWLTVTMLPDKPREMLGGVIVPLELVTQEEMLWVTRWTETK